MREKTEMERKKYVTISKYNMYHEDSFLLVSTSEQLNPVLQDRKKNKTTVSDQPLFEGTMIGT